MAFPVAEEFSVTRITVSRYFPAGFPHANKRDADQLIPSQDHIWLLLRFRALFAHVESPGSLASKYPAPPPGDEVSTRRTAKQWRVQAFLMNAEVRYSFYLRLLQDWIHKNGPGAGKKDWPL